MRNVTFRADRLCPEEAKRTAVQHGGWGLPPTRVLDTHGDHLGWKLGGFTSLVVYDKDPFQVVAIIRPARLEALPEGEGAVL